MGDLIGVAELTYCEGAPPGGMAKIIGEPATRPNQINIHNNNQGEIITLRDETLVPAGGSRWN